MRNLLFFIKILGLPWVLFRAKYALKMRLGYFEKKLPQRPWQALREREIFDRCIFSGTFESYRQWKSEHLPTFLFSPDDFPQWHPLFEQWKDPEIDREIENLKSGKFRYFENEYADCGFPPNWHRNPFSEKEAPNDSHWSRLGDFEFGDIKLIWEPSRFGFVFPLIRKYARTGDDDCARVFWELFEDWCEKNPPETGVNWKCGQEISLRLMAWMFAFYAFERSPKTTRTRVNLLAQAVYESARRIRENLDYALSQKNNHGISECVGLICAGTLFPELRGSRDWLKTGLKNLEKQITELVYPDGGFSQHSLNYHRVMLQDLTFALRLADLNKISYPQSLRERLALAADYARDFVFGENGDTPCWGANDGAHVFRLSECDYRDFRPHVQSAGLGYLQERYFPEGPWDEEALWFFGKSSVEKKRDIRPERSFFSAKTAGTHIIRRNGISVFLRCGNFIHRPGDNDLLHLDVWKGGRCIVGDTGSFSYNSPIPFVKSHNTISADGHPQMEQVSRFLKVPTNSGLLFEGNGELRAYHRGYERLKNPVRCERHVRVGEKNVVAEDELRTSAEHDYELTWVFPSVRISQTGTEEFSLSDGEKKIGTLRISAENGAPPEIVVLEGNDTSGEGFVSPYYNCRLPAQILVLKFTGTSLKIRSEFFFT